jgi:hypothetical protein
MLGGPSQLPPLRRLLPPSPPPPLLRRLPLPPLPNADAALRLPPPPALCVRRSAVAVVTADTPPLRRRRCGCCWCW